MTIAIPLQQFEGAKKNINDLKWDYVKKLRRSLEDENYYPDELEVNENEKNFLIKIYIDDSDQDGSVEGFESFCSHVSTEWDDKYEEIKSISCMFFVEHGFMLERPSHLLAQSLESGDASWIHFDWSHNKGTLTAMAEGIAGASMYLENDKIFFSKLEKSVKKIIWSHIDAVNKSIRQQTTFPWHERPRNVPFPAPNTYQINFTPGSDQFPENPPEDRGGRMFTLSIEMSVNESHNKKQVDSFKQLVHIMDRLWPRFLSEANQVLRAYDAQYAQYLKDKKYRGRETVRTSNGFWNPPISVVNDPNWYFQYPMTKNPLGKKQEEEAA